ncbi:hypothetical protein LJK88_00125 [Paenibacillus sp. P26]|nr:hypothetical protein LJK88_00125 [Paenibacillus sp. P26]UUZ91286.1 hypothetical protein LJK87_37250 [Paenibacillus sp. P25]
MNDRTSDDDIYIFNNEGINDVKEDATGERISSETSDDTSFEAKPETT